MPYIVCADQVEPYVRQFELAVVVATIAIAPFSSKQSWFAYASAHADGDDACSYVDASA